MKLLFKHFVYISILSLVVFIQNGFAQCLLSDNSRDALFITYERTTQVKVDNSDKLQNGVVLRLHNNSSCAVIITTGNADKLYKPLPNNPTVLQRVKREIDYNLPDEVLVPEVQYRYETISGFAMNVGGDMFFGFNLLGNRSVLFEVPFKHLDARLNGKIELPFQYAWEQENRAKNNYPSVKTVVQYWSNELPNEVKQKIKNIRD